MATESAQQTHDQAPTPVFFAPCGGADIALEQLLLARDIEQVISPRHAMVLLVIGDVTPSQENHLRRLHDQLPHPRATVWWRTGPDDEFKASEELIPAPLKARDLDHALRAIREAQQSLEEGSRLSETDLNNDRPTPWPDLDHPQAKHTPAKRRGPALAPQKAIQREDFSFTVGPFYPGLPPGLIARVTLQGDQIHSWRTEAKPYPRPAPASFARALREATPVAQLERERACWHLNDIASALEVEGLRECAFQMRLLATQLCESRPDYQQAVKQLQRLRAQVERSGFLQVGRGVGLIQTEQARRLGGTIARSAAIAVDARQDNPVYLSLGFEVICQPESDLHARRQQVLAEAEQALHLAQRAAERNIVLEAGAELESPLGLLQGQKQPEDGCWLLDSLLPGCRWSQALGTLVSLPLAKMQLRGVNVAAPA